MKKKFYYCLGITVIVFSLSFSNIILVHAGSKEMISGKKERYKDDNVENVLELRERKAKENKAYKEKMMLNSDKAVALLREIRNLLRQLNEGEK